MDAIGVVKVVDEDVVDDVADVADVVDTVGALNIVNAVDVVEVMGVVNVGTVDVAEVEVLMEEDGGDVVVVVENMRNDVEAFLTVDVVVNAVLVPAEAVEDLGNVDVVEIVGVTDAVDTAVIDVEDVDAEDAVEDNDADDVALAVDTLNVVDDVVMVVFDASIALAVDPTSIDVVDTM